jgi:membrane associated rhomboid family serine protease
MRPPPTRHPHLKRQPILNAPKIVTWIVGITVAAHVLRMVSIGGWLLPEELMARVFFTLAFIPARYTAASAWEHELAAILISPVGHTLIHGGWVHLLTNMGFLLAFGTPVARRMGRLSFLALYALCAIAGVALFTLISPYDITPLVGASGAVFGLLGAIMRIALYPPAGVPPAPYPFNNRRTAFIFAGIYLAINLLMGFAPRLFAMEGSIAWEAHLGGFVAGFLLMPFFDLRGRPT